MVVNRYYVSKVILNYVSDICNGAFHRCHILYHNSNGITQIDLEKDDIAKIN